MTFTLTSWRVLDAAPAEAMLPQPVTVATWPVKSWFQERGRHTGETVEEKVRREPTVRMLMS